MVLRIFSLFLLVLITSVCHSYAYYLPAEAAQNLNPEEIWERQKENFANTGGRIMCGDWALEIKTENEDGINVEFSKWGMGWQSAEKHLPKIFDNGDKMVYFSDTQNPTVFIKSNGKWRFLGHICSDVYYYDALKYRCPNNKNRMLDITGYTDNSLIIVHNMNCEYSTFKSCEPVKDFNYIVLLKDKNIPDRDVFINGNFRIERTNNSWIIDEKLCE